MEKRNLSPAKQALLEKWLQGQGNDESASIPHRPPNIPVPLSFPQQRQLFLELLEPGTSVNNLSVFLEFKGVLDPAALEQSANQIIARHEVLRTRFCFGQGLPAPQVLPQLLIRIPIVDLQHFATDEQEDEARLRAEREVLQSFDLNQAPLLRLQLYTLSDKNYRLLVVVHHSIADGWSLGVFLHELLTCYQNNKSGTLMPLPDLPVQYADFAHWQTSALGGAALQSSMHYWKKQLGGELPVLELPTDQPRSARQTFTGGTHRFVLTRETSIKLEQYSRQEDVTLFMTLLSAFYILLHRYSGQEEILVGTPIANRNRPELEPLIGVFINTLVLRTSFSGDPSFREYLQRVREIAIGAFTHQELPFEKLVEALRPKRHLSRTPLFQVLFNLQNAPMPELHSPGMEIKLLDIDRGVSSFDLSLIMHRSEGLFRGTVEYNRDLFTPETINRMFQSFTMLLEHAVAQPDRPISGLQLFDKMELHHLMYELNQTQLEYPRNTCVHQLFEWQVEQTPDKTAVVYQHTWITYDELNRRANVLAKHLQSYGVGPATRVGILMEKSVEVVVALLGVLKAGGLYVPIHTSFPAERIHYILNDAQARVLLTNVDAGSLGVHDMKVIHLNEDKLSSEDPCSNLKTNIDSGHLAYILYTSGSTGRPKGVMVHHAALVNFLWSMRQRPGISKGDVLLSVTAISFDIVALELFLPLVVGATVVIADKEMTANPLRIGQAIQQYGVNVMQATPATWQVLVESGWAGAPGLKALCGGDLLTRKLADQVLDRVGSLWNMYGPTETTIWSSVALVGRNSPITIGLPIGNTQLYILDRYLQPLSIGVVGELHIGGEGLALGYLNQEELTSEKFIPDCFHAPSGARLYKTGDLARYLPDGSIELLGRMDDQVKIQGHRIELGEIAAVMMQHSSVQEAIVITRREASGTPRLVAYYVIREDGATDAAELPEFVRKKLPGYMLPSVFIRVDGLPLTPNGKIDRHALPPPQDVRSLPGYVAPRNEEEEMLASIWQNVLEVEQVGILDNFFELGGASIQSLQIVAKANMAGFCFSAETIFEHQTIAELVAFTKMKTMEDRQEHPVMDKEHFSGG